MALGTAGRNSLEGFAEVAYPWRIWQKPERKLPLPVRQLADCLSSADLWRGSETLLRARHLEPIRIMQMTFQGMGKHETLSLVSPTTRETS